MSIKSTRENVRKRKWSRVEQALLAGGHDVLEAVVDELWHTGSLLIRRGARSARNEFLATLRARLSGHPDLESRLGRHLASLDPLERGYDSALKTLKESAAGRLDAATHAWALIDRLSAEITAVMEQAEAVLAASDGAVELQSIALPVTSDAGVAVDVAVETAVSQIANSLTMLAHSNDWSVLGKVVLPSPVTTSDDEVYTVGLTMMLGAGWSALNGVHDHVRLLDGTVETSTIEHGGKSVISIKFRSSFNRDSFAKVAVDRCAAQLLQVGVDVDRISVSTTEFGSKPVPLPPTAWVSGAEVSALIGLSETLNAHVIDDQERYCGLRLVEWTRGYAVLRLLASRNAQHPRITKSESEWVEALTVGGLTTRSAQRFLDAATFSCRSNDLYDTPLIAAADGTLTMSPGYFAATALPRIILSRLRRENEHLEFKGPALESAAAAIFEEAELRTARIHFLADDEEYECDLVVPWEGKLLLFECKHFYVPSARPYDVFGLWQSLKQACAQVKRNAESLHRHPERVREAFSDDVTYDSIVPVVLNGFPISFPPHDGTYFYDISALGRFFRKPAITYQILAESREEVVHRIWEGAPTVDILLQEMALPVQVKLGLRRYALGQTLIPLGADLVVDLQRLVLRNISVEELLAELG